MNLVGVSAGYIISAYCWRILRDVMYLLFRFAEDKFNTYMFRCRNLFKISFCIYMTCLVKFDTSSIKINLQMTNF